MRILCSLDMWSAFHHECVANCTIEIDQPIDRSIDQIEYVCWLAGWHITSCQIDIERLVAIIQLQIPRKSLLERERQSKRERKKTALDMSCFHVHFIDGVAIQTGKQCVEMCLSFARVIVSFVKFKSNVKKNTHTIHLLSPHPFDRVIEIDATVVRGGKIHAIDQIVYGEFCMTVYRKRLAFMFEVAIHSLLSMQCLIAWQ